MSKAEAIVVNEPKQKVVPTFNEKEVIGIVNGGIQTGQVAIPAGGVKLYKHQLTSPLFIINNSPTAISVTSSYDLNTIFAKSIIQNYSGRIVVENTPTSPNALVIYYSSSGTITSASIDISEITDTITEL